MGKIVRATVEFEIMDWEIPMDDEDRKVYVETILHRLFNEQSRGILEGMTILDLSVVE